MAKSNKGKPKLKNLTDEEILELSKRLVPNVRKGLYVNESQGSGDYQAVGDGTGALGFYQFVPSHHWSKIKAHAKANGYGDNISQADFLNNPELQESYFEKVWLPELVKESLKTFNLYGQDKGLTFEETIALSHFRGPAGARTMLRENRLDVREESNNKTGREFLNLYSEAVPKDIQITPEFKKDPNEARRLMKRFLDERKSIIDSDDSDYLKSMKLDRLEKEMWDSGYQDNINSGIDRYNEVIDENANKKKDRILKLTELVTSINDGEGSINPVPNIQWPTPNEDGGLPKRKFAVKDKFIRENFSDLIDYYPELFEKGNNDRIVGVNQTQLLSTLQREANSILPDDSKLNLVEIKNGKIHAGSDYSLSNNLSFGSLVGAKRNFLNIPTKWQNDLDPQIEKNLKIIPNIDPKDHWLTQEEEKKIVEDTKEAITDEPRDASVEHFNPYEPTEAQQQIANQEPKETGHELSDAFFDTSMFSGVEDDARPADVSDYKQPDIPYAEIGSSLFGIIMGSDAANTELPERDEVVSDALLRYTNELKRISQQGLSPEEEAYAKNNLRDSYAVGLDAIVRASGGNRNVVLGNASRLDAQMQRGLMDLSLADFQKREKALYQYGEAVKYINEVDLNKQIANNERAYQNAVATKEAGAQLMSSGIQSLLDNIQYYKENAPGSAQHALKSYYNRKVYHWDPNIKDNGKGDIMWSQSWYNNQRNNFKALRESQMDMGNKYASLSVDQKREVNNLLRDSNANQEIVWNFVKELYDYNQSPEAMVDEAQFSSQPNSQPTVPEAQMINSPNSENYDPRLDYAGNPIKTFSSDEVESWGQNDNQFTPTPLGSNTPNNPYGYGNRSVQGNYHKSNPTPNVFNIPGFNSDQSYMQARQNKALSNMTNNFVLDNFGGYSQEDLDNLILQSQSNRN